MSCFFFFFFFQAEDGIRDLTVTGVQTCALPIWAEMRSLAVVAGETRVRLGDVGGRAVQRREPVLLRHGQDVEGGLRAVAATYGHLEDLGLAAVSRNL